MRWLDVVVVLALIVLEGLFAAAEMALVTLREGQIRTLAEKGWRGRRLRMLLSDPNRFLASVQIGVTLTALLASAFGAVTLVDSAASALRSAGLASGAAEVLGFVAVTLVITYVTLVVGELAPKRLAIQRAEAASLLLGPPLYAMAVLFRPVIRLLSVSTNVVVRLLGGDPRAAPEAMTEEELRTLVTAHKALTADERALIDEVFAVGDRQVREVMVPRTEVAFLDAATPLRSAGRHVVTLPYSRYPVFRGTQDNVIGFVHVRDLLAPAAGQRAATVGDVVRRVAQLPDVKRLLPALSEMRRSGAHLAVVVDEFGGTAGIVTLEDVMEELVGEIRDEFDVAPARATPLRAGVIELDAGLNREDFGDVTGRELPEGPFDTVGGYVMTALGRLAEVGDAVHLAGASLTVTQMDGHRIARITMRSRPVPASGRSSPGSHRTHTPATGEATDSGQRVHPESEARGSAP